ncbi:hypothetical protein [Phreatobacter stygius]|uniref:hypothetical protein n=1 Tax=Phreatobacter stygius TaxID=1940610 RepID=UPI001476D11E|nr:hypothetical protein [Phreatobacter stygius]
MTFVETKPSSASSAARVESPAGRAGAIAASAPCDVVNVIAAATCTGCLEVVS